MKDSPRNILLMKGHSAGVGDILRSSAAWRALKDTYPGVKLHLLFLTTDPGYVSEELMARHHLLASYRVRTKWPNTLALWRHALDDLENIVRETQTDMIIDFEPNGLRTPLYVWLLRRRVRVATVGLNSDPGRGLFFERAGPSFEVYARRHGLAWPMQYTERDFAALEALGIRREGRPIELEETPEAVRFRLGLRSRLGIPEHLPIVGLNVGCGTQGALERRPNLDLLRAWLPRLQQEHGCAVVLTGAPFEKAVNEQLLAGYRPPNGLPIFNLAGETKLIELPGLLRACSLFVSPDSGPYHMAVALRVPTVVLFHIRFPASEHDDAWVRRLIATSPQDLPPLEDAVRQLKTAYPWQTTAATA